MVVLSSAYEDLFPFKWIGGFPPGLGGRSEEHVVFREMLNVLPGEEMMSPSALNSDMQMSFYFLNRCCG